MKILLTGLGSIGRRHARILQNHPEDFKLLAYRSGTSPSGNEFGIEEYTDLDKALARNPDIAFITNPTYLHVETALRCARANCHLFIEKPLSHTLDSVDELIEEVSDRELIAQMGCQLRFDPLLRRIQNLLHSNKLGCIYSYRAYSGSYLPEWRPSRDHRTSYSADPQRGGGVVLDLIHELDYTHWLFGKPSRVRAELKYSDSLEIDSEALAEIIIRTKENVIGNLHLDYCRRQPRRRLEVVGERGVIVGDILNGELVIEKQSSSESTQFDYDRDDRFKDQLNYFLNHIDSRMTPENDLVEGKEVLNTALKVREAHHYD